MAAEDAALAQLLREAAHDDATRDRIKLMYDLLLAELTRAIRCAHPSVTPTVARDHAYVIVCAAEHNVLMRNLGYPAARSRGAAKVAHRLIADALR